MEITEKETVMDDLKERFKGDASLIRELLPSAKKRGYEWVCGNVMGDKGSSFSYNEQSGKWADFATGETGSSIVDLIIAQKGVSVKEAFDFLRLRAGESPIVIKPKETKKVEVKQELEAFPDNVFPSYAYVDGNSYRVSRIWKYTGEDGKVYAYDCRVDYPDGSKDVIPFLWNSKENRPVQKMLPTPRMLCGLKDLADSKNVIIVEGCKTREATKYYFPNWCVLTWQGGSNATDKADWSKVKGKNVVIIPDADAKKDNKGNVLDWDKQAGQKAANSIAEILSKENRVRIVNTKEMAIVKDGWDIADAFEAAMAQEEVVSIVKDNLYDYISSSELDAESGDVSVVIEKKEEKNAVSYDDSYFRCLGERGSSTFFFKHASGQVIEFTPSKYEQKHLVSLAPLSYWEAHFSAKTGVDWLAACDYFSRVQEKIGYFNATNVRGRGCWFDDGKVVLHLGKTLVVDGKHTTIKGFKTKNIYEQREHININIDCPMPKEYSKKLIDVCKMARWEEDYYGEILAGWMFSAIVCGAMKFRSHLYLIGQSGSGKSWLQDNIIKPIMGKMCIRISSKTTEAGIRAMLNNDILPVICDENEKEDSKKDGENLQAIFDLARNASSEHSEPIVKSSPTGQIKVYYCRSSFLFSSIKTSMEKSADLNRTAFVRLKSKPKDSSATEMLADSKKFEKLREAVEDLIDPEYCEALISRAINLAGVMRQSQQIVSDVSAKIFGDRRQGDQMGMVIAGLHGLQSEQPVSKEEAEMYLRAFADNKSMIISDEDEKQEQGCLEALLRMPIRIQSRVYPLSRIISFLLDLEKIGEVKEEVEATLAYGGMMIKDDNLYLSVSPSSEHCMYFKTTMYGVKGWIDELSRCSKKIVFNTTRFNKVSKSRAMVIPLEVIVK